MKVSLDVVNAVLLPLFESGAEVDWDQVHSALLTLRTGDNRPDWDSYFMAMADVVGLRSTCDRGRSGAIIVKDCQVLAAGYAGSPPGFEHCDEVGHLMYTIIDDQGHRSEHCLRTLHAEENAITQAAKFGISVEGATIYCKMTPCFHRCVMKIIRAGIKRVVVRKRYHADQRSIEALERAGVQFVILDDQVEEY